MNTNPSPKARRAKSNPLAWVNLILVALLVLALNYISSQEYIRHDLTSDQRYTISERSVNVLSSDRVQNHNAPVRVIFAFQRSTQNYTRMRSLLHEYERVSKAKVEVEFFDPLRQPHRAREISQIYGIDFNQNICVVDARDDASIALKTFEDRGERKHVRILSGAAFIKYDTLPDESKRAVALMMDEVVCSAITEAVEGDMRQIYVVEGKGGISRDDDTLLSMMAEISASLNVQLSWLDIANVDKVPANAEGLLIIAPQSDFNTDEMKVIQEFWERDGRHAFFVALDPLAVKLPHFYRFLREQGLRPNSDRVLLRERKRAYYDISALFPKSLNCTKSFWNGTTRIGGQSMSITVEHGDENIANLRKLSTYPLLMTTPDYYGETSMDLDPKFDPNEDKAGPLCIGAAVTRGHSKDPNNLSTLMLIANTQMLSKDETRSEQRDYLRTLFAWMINRPEYAGKSENEDLRMKIDLNRHSESALELITLILMPLFAIFVMLVIWNTRRH